MSLFGTDGIRGLANGQLLTAELALDVAVAAAHILVETNPDKSHRPSSSGEIASNSRPIAIVGHDSRALTCVASPSPLDALAPLRL